MTQTLWTSVISIIKTEGPAIPLLDSKYVIGEPADKK